jgi:hypothetical protein
MQRIQTSLGTLFDRYVLQPFRNGLQTLQPYAVFIVTRLLYFALGCLLIGVITVCTFGVALVQYLIGYWLLVPKVHLERPAYFDYTTCAGITLQ